MIYINRPLKLNNQQTNNMSAIVHSSFVPFEDNQPSLEKDTTNVVLQFKSTTENKPNLNIRHNQTIVSRSDINGGSTGPAGRENQDAYCIFVISYNKQEYKIFIVADGHGIHGKTLADTSLEIINIVLSKFGEILENELILGDIFESFQEDLTSRFSQLTSGGATITLMIESDSFKICANLADCSAFTFIDTDPSNIIMLRDGKSINVISNELELTEDHGPESQSEVKRLLEMGAEIKFATSRNGPAHDAYNVQIIDGVKTYKEFPHTVQPGAFSMNVSGKIAKYIHMDRYSFNLSGSFGDFGCPFLRRRPTITKVSYPKGTQTKLIVGSDGYFNCFTSTQISQQLTLDPVVICQNAYERVGATFGHSNADNMTVIASSM